MPGSTGGAIIAGKSMSGKSTLSVGLAAESGASLISDDSVWWANGVANGFGAPATLRRGNPLWAKAQHLWYANDAERLVVRAQDLGGGPATASHEVTGIVFPMYEYGATTSSSMLSPAASFCRLLDVAIGSITPAVTRDLAQLAATTNAIQITYSEPEAAYDACCHVASTPVPPERLDIEFMPAAKVQEAGFSKGVAGVRFGDEVVIWDTRTAQVALLGGWRGLPNASEAFLRELETLGLRDA